MEDLRVDTERDDVHVRCPPQRPCREPRSCDDLVELAGQAAVEVVGLPGDRTRQPRAGDGRKPLVQEQRRGDPALPSP